MVKSKTRPQRRVVTHSRVLKSQKYGRYILVGKKHEGMTCKIGTHINDLHDPHIPPTMHAHALCFPVPSMTPFPPHTTVQPSATTTIPRVPVSIGHVLHGLNWLRSDLA